MRPLLKWAGGKRQLLPHLRRFFVIALARRGCRVLVSNSTADEIACAL